MVAMSDRELPHASWGHCVEVALFGDFFGNLAFEQTVDLCSG
jgi:hypothetical protein